MISSLRDRRPIAIEHAHTLDRLWRHAQSNHEALRRFQVRKLRVLVAQGRMGAFVPGNASAGALAAGGDGQSDLSAENGWRSGALRRVAMCAFGRLFANVWNRPGADICLRY